jgi:NADH-quinone oxidoreductase subunit N
MAFLPELILLAGALVLFVTSLGNGLFQQARRAAWGVGLATVVACLLSLQQNDELFSGAYRVDAFSQWLKLALSIGFVFILWLSGDLPDVRQDAKPEYYLFMTVSVTGLVLLVSCIDLITLIVALELSSFPLYFLVPMRRERESQRTQMESAIKYIMFGVAANGIMLFGLSYLFGLTGTTSIPLMMEKLQPVLTTPLATVGLAMLFAGLYYKLAVFPFHFWTPDVYQGGSNETAGLIASLPKLGAVAVLVRLVSLATPQHATLIGLLTCLAIASMVYGNLVALVQQDFKRLLGFSGIAHAGYALVGFVAMDLAGFTASLYYIVSYVLMVLACFIVICRVSRDGTNVAISDLAGLHRRSPWLAVTLLVGVFALAGLPPFAGFIGKLALLKAALAKGHLALVIITVVNAAIAIYYYLRVIREAYFRNADDQPTISLDLTTRVLCGLLILGILLLGIVPNSVLSTIASSLANLDTVAPALAAGW